MGGKEGRREGEREDISLMILKPVQKQKSVSDLKQPDTGKTPESMSRGRCLHCILSLEDYRKMTFLSLDPRVHVGACACTPPHVCTPMHTRGPFISLEFPKPRVMSQLIVQTV